MFSVCLVYSSFHHGMNTDSSSPCFYFEISYPPCHSLFRLDLFCMFFPGRQLCYQLCVCLCLHLSQRQYVEQRAEHLPHSPDAVYEKWYSQVLDRFLINQ